MSRPLAAAFLVVLALTKPASAAGGRARSTLACEGQPDAAPADAAYRELRRAAEAGALYRHAAARLGPPVGCRFERSGSALRLHYRFSRGATLEAGADPSIEASQVRLEMRGITEHRARALLRDAERDAFGAAGCGIDWDQPARRSGPPDRRVDAWDGGSCNCRGTVEHRGGRVVAIALRGAC